MAMMGVPVYKDHQTLSVPASHVDSMLRTYRVGRVLLVLLKEPAVGKLVDHVGRILGVTADTDMHLARLVCDDAHEVQERHMEVGSMKAAGNVCSVWEAKNSWATAALTSSFRLK